MIILASVRFWVGTTTGWGTDSGFRPDPVIMETKTTTFDAREGWLGGF